MGRVSKDSVQQSKVTIPWEQGLHLRRAAKLVRVAQRFRSTIFLQSGAKIADLRNILSVIALCATMGTVLDLVVNGDDERDAAIAVEQIFSLSNDESLPGDAASRTVA